MTKLVARLLLLMRTTELVAKPVPLTVRVKAGAPVMADTGLRLVSVGARALMVTVPGV